MKKLSATVHWGGIWIGDSYVDLSPARLKKIVKALLDAGIPVNGYWSDLNYRSIDKRIGPGKRDA